MKYSVALITAIAFFALFSCSQAKQDSGQTQQLPAVQQTTREQAAPVVSEPVMPVETAPAPQPLTAQTPTEVMLNPAHGQPYHRCDIPVGSPLPSSSAAVTQPSTTAPLQVTSSQSSVSTPGNVRSPVAPTVENASRVQPTQTPNTISVAGTKPKLNPAHGQPHHRCDIPVGSALP